MVPEVLEKCYQHTHFWLPIIVCVFGDILLLFQHCNILQHYLTVLGGIHLVRRTLPRVFLVLHHTSMQPPIGIFQGLQWWIIVSSYTQKLVKIQTLYVFENLQLPLYPLFCRKISTDWKWNYCMTCNYYEQQNYKYLCYRYAHLSYCILLGNSDEGIWWIWQILTKSSN